jgi:hypothetical protein
MDFKYAIRRKAVVADIAIKKTTNCNSVERGKDLLGREKLPLSK